MIEKEIPMLADHLYGEEFLLCELKAISFEWFQRCVFNYVNLLNVDNRTCGIMKLLTTLDNAMHGIIERMIMSQQYVVKEVTALNGNCSETGIVLLPYVKCAWQRGARCSQPGFKINHCMDHLYYVPLSSSRIRGSYTKLDVVHVFAYRNMFFEAHVKRKLKISISPVTKHEILKDINYSSDKNGNHFFEINEIMNQSEIGRCVLADTLVACQRESDILVFPELLGFEELNKKMQYLLGVTLIGNKSSSLTVLPSVWKENRNTADILLGNGIAIYHQDKQVPMIFNGSCEHIFPDNTLYFIHSPGIGRVCVMICKDDLPHDYLNVVLDQIRASLILIPSFSTGSYDFDNVVAHCRAYDCNVAWINACAAKHLKPDKPENFRLTGLVLHSGKESGALDRLIRPEYCQYRRKGVCLFDSKIDLD